MGGLIGFSNVAGHEPVVAKYMLVRVSEDCQWLHLERLAETRLYFVS
jgi:hypothetical protein